MIIYKIINKINEKIYIGQTTRSLEQRIKGHKESSKYHTNLTPITRAMIKYGFENFQFSIVCECDSQKELDKMEIEFIKLNKSLTSQNGYNVKKGGRCFGLQTDLTKKKIGLSQLGALNHMYGKSRAQNAASKEVVELTTGFTFESASLAAQHFNVSVHHACAVARGGRGSTGGRVFRFLDINGEPIVPTPLAKIKAFKTIEAVLPKYKHLI